MASRSESRRSSSDKVFNAPWQSSCCPSFLEGLSSAVAVAVYCDSCDGCGCGGWGVTEEDFEEQQDLTGAGSVGEGILISLSTRGSSCCCCGFFDEQHDLTGGVDAFVAVAVAVDASGWAIASERRSISSSSRVP